MQLSGDYILSIPHQSGLGAQFNCSFGSGVYQFGLTGSNETLDFYVSGSRIFDTDRKFIYSSPYQAPVSLEIFLNNSIASFYVDGELLSYRSGTYSPLTGFFSKSDEYYENTFSVSGDLPILQYTGLSNFDTGIDIVTGALVNFTPFRKFRIANIYATENTIPQTTVIGWQTGDIAETGKIYIQSLLPEAERTGLFKTKVETNFGVLDLDINLDTNATDDQQLLRLWPEDSFFKEYQYKIYVIESSHNFGSRILDVRLDHVSGGVQYPYYVPATGVGTGYYTGNIIRYGYVTGAISGYLEHGVYQTGATSKYYIITGLVNGTATGAYLEGLYSGYLITQTNVLSGYSKTFTSGDSGYHYWGVGTGTITGIYPHVSGTGTVYLTRSGSAPNWSGGALNTTTGISTGDGLLYRMVYDDPLAEDDGFGGVYPVYVYSSFENIQTSDFFSVTHYSGSPQFSGVSGGNYVYTGRPGYGGFDCSGNITFESDYTGNLISVQVFPEVWENSTVTLTGTGNFGSVELTTGYYESFTGAISGEALITTGQIPFTGMWDLATGKYYPNVLSFRSHNWITGGTGYVNTGSTVFLPEENTDTIVEVFYDGRDTSGVNTAKLSYSDGYQSGELIISGVGKTF